MAFNPKEHITKMGNREYLEVKWRLVWYREVYPNGRIETDAFTVGDMVAVKAIVTDNEGRIIASGLSTVRDASQKEATWSGRIIEKAETSAIGRALAVAGFGTQFTDEDEGDYLADSPTPAKQKAKAPTPAKPDINDIDAHLGASKTPEPVLHYTDEIKVVDVKKGQDEKLYIVAASMSFFTREPFRKLGFPVAFIDKLGGKVGQVFLPDESAIRIAYIEELKGGKKTRKPVKMHRVDTQETIELT